MEKYTQFPGKPVITEELPMEEPGRKLDPAAQEQVRNAIALERLRSDRLDPWVQGKDPGAGGGVMTSQESVLPPGVDHGTTSMQNSS